MAAESREQLLRQLLVQSKETEEADYAVAEGVTHFDLDLEILVRKKLVANAHSANIGECVEQSVRKGGGVGESTEQQLLKTGVTGWT